MSVNDENPGSLFGGTWVAWGTGRVPVGINTSDGNFNTVEKTGGSQTHTHNAATSGAYSGTSGGTSGTSGAYSGTSGKATGNTGAATGNTGSTTLNINQIPSHSHSMAAVMQWPTSASGWGYSDAYWNSGQNPAIANLKTTNAAGGGQGHTHSLNSHTHSLNSHTHSIPSHTHSLPSHTHSIPSHTHSIPSTSGSNLQPYITCYMWKRTA